MTKRNRSMSRAALKVAKAKRLVVGAGGVAVAKQRRAQETFRREAAGWLEALVVSRRGRHVEHNFVGTIRCCRLDGGAIKPYSEEAPISCPRRTANHDRECVRSRAKWARWG